MDLSHWRIMMKWRLRIRRRDPWADNKDPRARNQDKRRETATGLAPILNPVSVLADRHRAFAPELAARSVAFPGMRAGRYHIEHLER